MNSSKKHAVGGILTGFFSGEIMRGIASQLFGEIAKKVGEEAVLKIQKGGKGYPDEVLYALVSLNELDSSELEKLEDFAIRLWKDDNTNHTENLKKLVLFIATSAEEFKTVKKNPNSSNNSGKGKSKNKKKAPEKKVRDTATGGKFLKALTSKSTHEEMIDFCRAYHVFDESSEGYKRIAKMIIKLSKENLAKAHASVQPSVDSNADSLNSLSESLLDRARQRFESSRQ